jgi:hypothetical protein
MRPEEWAPALGRLERLELPEEGGGMALRWGRGVKVILTVAGG